MRQYDCHAEVQRDSRRRGQVSLPLHRKIKARNVYPVGQHVISNQKRIATAHKRRARVHT